MLVPGVSPTNTASTQLFAETSAVPGQGISVGSQRNLSNNFLVDGLSANDDAAGLSGSVWSGRGRPVPGGDFGGQAELGRALGGYINVVTKSGTNTLRGNAYGYFRDESPNAANALTGAKLPMSQQQFGASVGGPIQVNRTSYFANVEQRRLDQTGLTTISRENTDLVNARLQSVGYPGQLVTTGIYPNPVHSTNVMGKVDHQFSGRDQLAVRYSLYDISSSNARGAGGLAAPSASSGLDTRDQALAVSNTVTLSSRTVNETRAQVAYSDLEARSTDLVGPAVNIAGVASFGTLSGSPRRASRRCSRWSSACHISVERMRRPSTSPVPTAGPIRSPRWRTSWLARTTTRASRRPSASWLANALLSARNTTDLSQVQQTAVSLAPTQAGAPSFPNILAGPVQQVTLINLTTMDRRLQNAYSRQASIEVERQVSALGTLSVGYQYLRGDGLLMSINQNVPTCVATGTNNGCRPNANYANNSQYSSAGRSTYHALLLSFLQRPTSWGSYRLSYALSKSMNNVGEFFLSSHIDPFDLSKDWGRSDDDQRHRLTINGSIDTSMAPATNLWDRLSHGLQVSGMLQTYSALPFNITSGLTTLQGTAGRPIVNGLFIPRNSGVGNDFFALNARVSRSFKVGSSMRVEGMLEAFNLTNRRNALTRNTNFGTGGYPASPLPTFNRITAVAEPRSLQLAARVTFEARTARLPWPWR